MPDRPLARVSMTFTTRDPHAMMRDWSHALGLDDAAALMELQVADRVQLEVVPIDESATPVDPFTAPVLVTLRRLLCFFPGRGWQMTLKGRDWLTLDIEPAWGEEATPANDKRAFAIWLTSGDAYRVGDDGAVEDDPLPLDLMNPEQDRL
jgi:hypothetical protein